jgi:hypothetical protein
VQAGSVQARSLGERAARMVVRAISRAQAVKTAAAVKALETHWAITARAWSATVAPATGWPAAVRQR